MAQALVNSNAAATRARPDVALVLFFTLLGTYAYFWQSRDWNAASRLMLTYSLVDRHDVRINGLERQAGYGEYNLLTRRFEMVDGDLAQVGPDFFTDKAPGQSLLGALVYAPTKLAGWLDEHPTNEKKARAYWPADYWVTLGTSGVLTAAVGVLIYAFCLRLGTTHRGGVLLGLAYGLGTPALLYATLFYGHQASAFCTVASFFLLHRAAHEGRANAWNMLMAGLLAGFSVVVEYQTAIISAVLGLYAVFAIRRFRGVATFAVAAMFAASLLAAYNYRAFGDPMDLGYAHEVSRQFKAIHSANNPLGIRLPNWEQAQQVLLQILWGPFRGLTFYAPVLFAAPLGLFALLWRRQWGVALVATAAIGWMVTLNVSYPLPEGGWCTGPRLIVPAIPFGVLLVGGLIGAARNAVVSVLVGLAALAGALVMLACVAVGGRFPIDSIDLESPRGVVRIDNPVVQIALPHWRGAAARPIDGRSDGEEADFGLDPLCPLCRRHTASFLAGGRQFERNVGRWLVERFAPVGWIPAEPSPWQALQFVPLGVYWVLMVGLLLARTRRERSTDVRGRGAAAQSSASKVGGESKT